MTRPDYEMINAQKRTKVSFVVEIDGIDTPPDWGEKIEKQLRREMFLLYGDNVIVEREKP